MTEYKVHRVRFVDFMPKAINSAAFDVGSKCPKVALSREDGSIEIRDPGNDWIVTSIIPGQDGRTMEHLVWCNGRLFSGGLNGEIIEWDLESLRPKYTQDSYGGPVWCLKFSNSKKTLAAGCEDGSIRLFEVQKDSILYEKCLHKQESRILSLAWSHCDNHIITGGFDCTIRMYNVKTGQITSRMTTDNMKDSNTMVWSIEMLNDMTIVIGDSLGNTQFWDCHTGTLLQSFRSHKADVLAVATCNDFHTVYSTGVDSKVTQFNLVQVGDCFRWVQTKSIRSTNHDTRTLAVCTSPYNCMVSGGVDPRVVVYDLNNFSSQTFIRYSCLPQSNSIQLASSSNLLLFREQHKVNIWQLQDTQDSSSKVSKLIEIASNSADHLLSSAISPSGKFLAYSNLSKNRLLQTNFDGQKPTLKKLSHKLAVSSVMEFTHDESILVTAGFENKIHLVSIESGESTAVPFDKNVVIRFPFIRICVSHDSEFACVVDANSKASLISIQRKEFLTTIPSVDDHITACSFHPETNNLFLITSKKRVYEFDILKKNFLPWTLGLNKTEMLSDMGRQKDKAQCITFNPSAPEEMFVSTKEILGKIVYGCDLDNPEKKKVKNVKRKKLNDQQSLKTYGNFNNVIFFDCSVAGELVVVERPMSNILENLPTTLKIKKFGY